MIDIYFTCILESNDRISSNKKLRIKNKEHENKKKKLEIVSIDERAIASRLANVYTYPRWTRLFFCVLLTIYSTGGPYTSVCMYIL